MNPHTEKALENIRFLDQLNTSFPNDHFDWKVTVLFYAALHLVHALAHQNKRSIGQSHDEVLRNIKPADRVNQRPKMPFKKDQYEFFYTLYDLSRTARYKAGSGPVLAILNKVNYEKATILYSKLVYYLVKQRGLTGVDHLVVPLNPAN